MILFIYKIVSYSLFSVEVLAVSWVLMSSHIIPECTCLEWSMGSFVSFWLMLLFISFFMNINYSQLVIISHLYFKIFQFIYNIKYLPHATLQIVEISLNKLMIDFYNDVHQSCWLAHCSFILLKYFLWYKWTQLWLWHCKTH